MAKEIRISLRGTDVPVYRDMIIPDDMIAGDLMDITTALYDWSFDAERAIADSAGIIDMDEYVRDHMDGLCVSYRENLWIADVTVKGEKDGDAPMVTGYNWRYIGDEFEGPEDFNKMNADASDAALPGHYDALRKFAELPRFDPVEFNDWLKSC
jgi:hypothetical protein